MHKTTFALYFGNRGFFPGELIASARNGRSMREKRVWLSDYG